MADELGEIIGRSGEFAQSSLKDYPVLYFPSSENNFVFFCEYTTPSQEVNFVFPDYPCSELPAIDGYSGEYAVVDEIVIGEILALGYSGETAFIDLDTTLFIPISNAYSGEYSDSTLLTSLLIEANAYSGEWLRGGNLILPDIIYFSADAYSGEYSDSDLTIFKLIEADAYSGEYSDSSLSIFISEPFSVLNAYSGEYTDSTLSTSTLLIADAYSGEYSDSSLLTSTLLIADAYSGEYSDSDLTIFPSEPFSVLNAYSGEYSDSDLTISVSEGLGISNAYSGEYSNSDLSLLHLLILNAYSGEYTDSTLSTTQLLIADAYSGEYSDSTLSIFPSEPIGILNAYSGEYTDSDLTISKLFIADAYSGEYSDSSLSIFPSEPIGISNAYSGEYSDLILATEQSFELISYSGEYSDSSLSIFPSEPIGISNAYSGEINQFILTIEQGLFPKGYSGEYLTCTLNIFESGPIGIFNAYSGNLGALNLSISPYFRINAYNGNSANLDLYTAPSQYFSLLSAFEGKYSLSQISTSVTFKGVINYTGELIEPLNLETVLSSYLSLISGYSGENVSSLTLNENHLLFIRGYTDNNFNLDLVISESEPIYVRGYTGSCLEISLNLSESLSASAYDGSVCNLFITNEPNIYCYSGETGKLNSLSLTSHLDLSAFDGSRATAEFAETNQSFYFDVFNAYNGQKCDTLLNQYWTTYFRLRSKTGIICQCDIDSTTYFDLTTDACCGPRPQSNNLNLKMAKAPNEPYGLVESRNNVIIRLDLYRAINFSLRAYSGEHSKVTYQEGLLELNAYNGSALKFKFEQDLIHKHTKGYFIPNGNLVVTELIDVLPEDDIVHRCYGGESVSCDLSIQKYFSFDFYVGQNNISTLTTTKLIFLELDAYSGEILFYDIKEDKPMSADAHHGQYGYVPSFTPLPLLKSVNYSGEYLEFDFYEDPIHFYSGETTYLYLSAHYLVEFLENGCLDNEFRYYDENGVEIEELYNPVPIEGEPYFHKVKARCISERSPNEP